MRTVNGGVVIFLGYLSMVIYQRRVVGLTEVGLARFMARVSRALRLRGEVNVLITSSRELKALNARFRKKDEPTDVLSFPSSLDPASDLLGDVAISADIASQNARKLGHSAADEIKILTLHGMLHLAGYDHEHDNGKMSRKEERLRVLFGLPSGLISRTQRTLRSSLKNKRAAQAKKMNRAVLQLAPATTPLERKR